MKLINEAEIYDTWAPLIESKAGITDEGKKEWLTKYCHYHSLNESAGAYQTLGTVNGMGAVAPPLYPGMGGFAGTPNQGFYNADNFGSGDKFPSLLPLAIQVAAKTVGFDIVPVIPMSGPTGVLSYLDYVYAGGELGGVSDGTTSNGNAPDLIKFPVNATAAAAFASMSVGTPVTIDPSLSPVKTLVGKFVGLSRIDGFPILRVDSLTSGASVAQVVISGATISTGGAVAGNAVLVKTLEDHIQGFSGAGFNNTNDFQGPYVDGTKTYNPMLRGVGESNYYKSLGLSTFTKFVEADTFQVAASVTTEQIQDLNKQFGIDVVSMIENALVNGFLRRSTSTSLLEDSLLDGLTTANSWLPKELTLTLTLK